MIRRVRHGSQVTQGRSHASRPFCSGARWVTRKSWLPHRMGIDAVTQGPLVTRPLRPSFRGLLNRSALAATAAHRAVRRSPGATGAVAARGGRGQRVLKDLRRAALSSQESAAGPLVMSVEKLSWRRPSSGARSWRRAHPAPRPGPPTGSELHHHHHHQHHQHHQHRESPVVPAASGADTQGSIRSPRARGRHGRSGDGRLPAVQRTDTPQGIQSRSSPIASRARTHASGSRSRKPRTEVIRPSSARATTSEPATGAEPSAVDTNSQLNRAM